MCPCAAGVTINDYPSSDSPLTQGRPINANLHLSSELMWNVSFLAQLLSIFLTPKGKLQ